MSTATMNTSQGPIDLELFDEDAPETVANFRKLAGENFYDGVIFHRVIPDFMIQGGCPQGTGTGGPGYTFKDEFNQHKVVRGALAMANAGPNTNGSQFFIVTTDAAPWLDGKHTVFGQVTDGMETVDAIEGAPDRRSRPSGRAAGDRDRSSSTRPSSITCSSGHRSGRGRTTIGAPGYGFVVITLPAGEITYHRPPLRFTAWPACCPGDVSGT